VSDAVTEGSVALRTRARIGAHVIWDHLAKPMAVTAQDVPWGVSAMTTQWLTAVLGRGVPDAVVERFELGDGDAGSSVRRRVRVTWNAAGRSAGLPELLFTKATPTLLTRLSSGMAAAGERRFYEQIRPELDIEAPWLFHSAYDRVSGRSIHVFDDLAATKGARFCNYQTTIDRTQADEVVDTLAAFHGRFRGSERFAHDLKWVTTYEAFLRTGERNGIRVGHDRAMLEAADVIPARVVARREEIWPAAVRGLAMHGAEPRTLLHSDVHLGNWYVTNAGRMGLCDWACVCSGHWARDFAYAVSTTLTVEQRRGWEHELLSRYLRQMHELCGLATPVHVAFEQYRRQLSAALLMWTPTLCHPPTMPDMQPPEMSREMIHRMTTAIDDLDALDLAQG
jgi:hypothetical protein